jgi:hypothetical protein
MMAMLNICSVLNMFSVLNISADLNIDLLNVAKDRYLRVIKHKKILVAHATLFEFSFTARRTHFTYSNFAWGVAWWTVVWT